MNFPNGLKRNWAFIALGLVLAVILYFIFTSGSQVINPNKDKLLEGASGKEWAALYKYNELFGKIDQNEEVLRLIQYDINTFARTTRSEFSDPTTLVGFTFKDGVKVEGDKSTFTGNYYGLKDDIKLDLTSYGKGVYTLSITNLKDNVNIDDSLRLNGKRNALIRTLPIQKDKHSIRYYLQKDQIIVTFYDGYKLGDVEDVEKLIQDSLGSTTSSDVVYSINAKGVMSLDKIKQAVSQRSRP